MSQNKLRENELPEQEETGAEEQQESAAPKKRRTARPSRGFVRFMSVFGWFDRNQLVHGMPFILFLTVLIIFYIANSYYAERVIRDIDKTKLELKEKNAEFISTRSELMFQSKQSEVARSVSPFGIYESKEPPEKLIASDKNPESN